MKKQKYQHCYTIEIAGVWQNPVPQKPEWTDLICLTGNFNTRKEALSFFNNSKDFNKISCRFFIVTHQIMGKDAVRIEEL